MSFFLYRLDPQRPGFGPTDMTDEEAAVMGAHGAYWAEQIGRGTAVVFGPVLDPAGSWGLGVVEADGIAEVEALRDRDPAITSGLTRATILPLAVAMARPAPG